MADGHVIVIGGAEDKVRERIILSRFVALDPAVEEAAMDLGATELKTFLAITLPRREEARAREISIEGGQKGQKRIETK